MRTRIEELQSRIRALEIEKEQVQAWDVRTVLTVTEFREFLERTYGRSVTESYIRYLIHNAIIDGGCVGQRGHYVALTDKTRLYDPPEETRKRGPKTK